MVKSLKFIVNTSVFEGLAGCTCERNRYQKNIKSATKSIPKSMKNQYKIVLEKGIPKTWNYIEQIIKKGIGSKKTGKRMRKKKK